MVSRHSYAGAESKHSWSNMPQSSPHAVTEDEEDMFFSGPPDTSFSFDVSPSPRGKPLRGRDSLPKKYNPRDSGVALCELEDDESSFRLDGAGPSASAEWAVPSASTSVSTVQSSSSGDEFAGLVTPMLGPGEHPAWPSAVRVAFPDADDDGEDHSLANLSVQTMPDRDAFIIRTLAAAAKGAAAGVAVPDARGGKRAPGTPVKKVRTSFMGGRPWQSAFATGKVGFSFGAGGDGAGAPAKGAKKKPRASMPAAFPAMGTHVKAGKRKVPAFALGMAKKALGDDSDSEEEKDSPSAMRQVKYEGLGLGRPSAQSKPAKGVAERARWLMRRSSSGQFESGSESTGSAGTPTRRQSKGQLPFFSCLRTQ